MQDAHESGQIYARSSNIFKVPEPGPGLPCRMTAHAPYPTYLTAQYRNLSLQATSCILSLVSCIPSVPDGEQGHDPVGTGQQFETELFIQAMGIPGGQHNQAQGLQFRMIDNGL